MEVTLKVFASSVNTRRFSGFNPCFNGSDSKSAGETGGRSFWFRFNPCFNGSDSKRAYPGNVLSRKGEVSILVLMEVTLKDKRRTPARLHKILFQSLF